MSDYRYPTKGGRDNVTIRIPNQSRIEDDDVAIGVFWEPVILWLADKFPTWKFQGINIRSAGTTADETYMPWTWKVFCDGEELGTIHRDYYGCNACYAISNERISHQRERGNAHKTVKEEQAKKLVMRHFKPKTLHELLHEVDRQISGDLHTAAHNTWYEWRKGYEAMMMFMAEHCMEDFDALTKKAVDLGFTGDTTKTHDAWESACIKKGIEKCREQKNGAVVLIHGNTYAVLNDSGQISTYENATLPDSIKRKVGLLKLLEYGDFLIDVGYRKGETQFYISMEDDNATS